MKKVFFLCVLMVYMAGTACKAQAGAKDTNSFILQGYVDGKEGDTVKLDFYPSYSIYFVPAESVYAVIKNGQFTFKLSGIKHPGYINIWLRSSNDYGVFPGIPSPLLIEPGDHIGLHLNDGQTLFTGTGSAKYNCRVAMDTKRNKINNHDIPVIYDYLQGLEFSKRRNDTVMSTCLKILSRYKNSMSMEAYEILKLDYEGSPRYGLLATLFLQHSVIDARQYLDNNAQYFDGIAFHTTRPDISANYTDFLFMKERLLSAIDTSSAHESQALINSRIFHTIESKYTGLVKDKLRAMMLASSFELGDSTEIFKQQALSNMTTPEYREMIEKNNSLFGKGAGVYEFHLRDSSGHIINLSDYRGKVVVLDFYFLGCSGCAYLSKALTPVISHYKDNPNVVFISINTDKDRDWFIKAVNSGKYTHPESINVYTNGLGQEHEMIKYYGFQGYPQFLLADKHGKILYENPPIPNLDHKTGEPNPQDPNVLKLIEIIDNGLQQE